MSTEVDTRVALDLHPATVQNLDGYDDETAIFLAPTVEAFETAYRAVSAVHDARVVAEKNGAWTEENRLMMMDNLAGKKMAGVTKMFDSVSATLGKSIAGIEQALSAPVEQKASASVSGEIRGYVRGPGHRRPHEPHPDGDRRG